MPALSRAEHKSKSDMDRVMRPGFLAPSGHLACIRSRFPAAFDGFFVCPQKRTRRVQTLMTVRGNQEKKLAHPARASATCLTVFPDLARSSCILESEKERFMRPDDILFGPHKCFRFSFDDNLGAEGLNIFSCSRNKSISSRVQQIKTNCRVQQIKTNCQST